MRVKRPWGWYEGKKSSKNKLSKWSKEDWQTREEDIGQP